MTLIGIESTLAREATRGGRFELQAATNLRGAVPLTIERLGNFGHASVQQTQRYLNVTDEELRKGLEVSWKRRALKAVVGGQNA